MKMLVTVLIRFCAITIQMTMRLPHVETVAIETKSTDQMSCRHHGRTYAFTSSAIHHGNQVGHFSHFVIRTTAVMRHAFYKSWEYIVHSNII